MRVYECREDEEVAHARAVNEAYRREDEEVAHDTVCRELTDSDGHSGVSLFLDLGLGIHREDEVLSIARENLT